MKDYKRILCFMFMPILLILSNLILPKVTSVFGFSVEASIFIYPFTYLIILFLVQNVSKKDAYFAVLSSAVIQMLLLALYEIILLLPIGNQTAFHLGLFLVLKPNYLVSIIILIGFIIGQITSIHIYEDLKERFPMAINFLISMVSGFIIDSAIFTIIYGIFQYSVYELGLLLIAGIIKDLFISLIITIFFLLFHIKTKKKIK